MQKMDRGRIVPGTVAVVAAPATELPHHILVDVIHLPVSHTHSK